MHGGSIDEIIRLLNKRQRAIEETGDPCLRVLYLETTFSSLVHPPVYPAVSTTAGGAQLKQMMSPANLHRVTACNRCCLAQDRVVFVVNLNQNHWVCVGLDMADCTIIYLDSLSTSSKKVPLPAPRLCLLAFCRPQSQALTRKAWTHS